MITGQFISVTVPSSLSVGSDLIIRVAFSANNPEGSVIHPWKTFLIADVPMMGQFELDTARRYFPDTSPGVQTFNLGPIPDISPAPSMSVSLFLFTHWDANYDWNWGEYAAWLEGYDVPFTHLDSEYKFISVFPPEEPPPPSEEYRTLEVDITPSNAGYVITNPNPVGGYKKWYNGTTGVFSFGTVVQVTAYPSVGYVFEKWSDEIEGGVNYSNPAYVKPMTEHRTVKAHFIEVELPPGCSIDADCPEGYICQGGVCIPGEEPPTPPEEKKFPWGTAAIVTGAAVLLIAVAKPKKK